MIFSIVVAVAENGVIGNNNQLLWHIPEDLKYFKQLTMGHSIVMGRKTFESIGKPLPGRKNIVLSKNMQFKADAVFVCRSLEEVKTLLQDENEVFIIGGSEIYRQFLPFTQKIYLTKVFHDFRGDSYFPKINLDEWEIKDLEPIQTSTKANLPYQFQLLTRKQ